jgi:hypothetical protein
MGMNGGTGILNMGNADCQLNVVPYIIPMRFVKPSVGPAIAVYSINVNEVKKGMNVESQRIALPASRVGTRVSA